MGRRLGDARRPAAGLACAPAPKFSMPGMMETVLNVGLNDESVARPGRRRATTSGSRWTPTAGCSRCSARTVLGHRRRASSPTRSTSSRRTAAPRPTSTSTSTTCASWSRPSRTSSREHAGRDFPQDPREQLDLAVRAVFDSWNTERAVLYRRQERIPEDLGTAVNVQAMVFGNRGDDSGSGVALHPRPGVRQPGRVRRLPAERAGRGRRRRHPQHRLAGRPRARSTRRRTTSCSAIMATLEQPLPRHVRHRVHHRARQALDAADPGRQAHPRGGVPDRRAHGRRGPDRHRRGAAPGHRRPARPADVPALRREGRARRCSPRA